MSDADYAHLQGHDDALMGRAPQAYLRDSWLLGVFYRAGWAAGIACRLELSRRLYPDDWK